MPPKGKSQERRALIREILGAEVIGTQRELVRRLRERGVAATQSSVSRDVRELGLVRVGGRWVLAEASRLPERHTPRLLQVAGYITEVAPAGPYVVVVKTPAGLAASVALALDEARWAEVVGTVAGDDTFFIAVPGRQQQARVLGRLAALRREASGE